MKGEEKILRKKDIERRGKDIKKKRYWDLKRKNMERRNIEKKDTEKRKYWKEEDIEKKRY